MRPRPEERGTLAELGGALADALPEVSDDGGTILAHPLERAATAGVPPIAARIAAALAAGGLAALAATLAPTPVEPAIAAGGAAVAVGLLPRLGWLACAIAAVTLIAAERPGTATLLAAGLAPVPLLVRGTGRTWSLPALAPLLGVAALAGAYPALAGRASGVTQRAGLGAAGLWWLLLAEPLTGLTLLSGTDAPTGWQRDAGTTLHEVLEPLAGSGLLAIAALWAAATLSLPWLVPGRRLSVDIVGASAWAAGLGAGTGAIAEWAGAAVPRGLTAGAVAAGVLALLVPRLLPRDIVDP